MVQTTLTGEALETSTLKTAPAERLLATLAGLSALGFGALAFLLSLLDVGKRGFLAGFGGPLVTLIVTLVFGVLVLTSAPRLAQKPREASILIAAFSVVLLAFGGVAGAIAGILGLVAAGIVLVRELTT